MLPFSVTWQAPEFEYHPKGASWYWGSIAVAVILVAIAAWQANFLFGLFIVIAEILMLVWGNKEPRPITFVLNEKGVFIEDHKSYPIRDIESFSSFEDWSDEWSTIILDLKGHFRPSVRIHVPRNRFTEIEHAMNSVIPIVQKEQSLVDILERFLGF